jgi:hypothetical protein
VEFIFRARLGYVSRGFALAIVGGALVLGNRRRPSAGAQAWLLVKATATVI